MKDIVEIRVKDFEEAKKKRLIEYETFKHYTLMREWEIAIDEIRAEIDEQDKAWKTNLDKIKAEIDAQDLWLVEAGYSEYNMNIALNSIKRAIEESEVKND